MSYKRACIKSQKAKEFTKSVAEQTKPRSREAQAETADDDAPYSPGSAFPTTTTESQGSTPYSPGSGHLNIVLGSDEKESLQGRFARIQS